MKQKENVTLHQKSLRAFFRAPFTDFFILYLPLYNKARLFLISTTNFLFPAQAVLADIQTVQK